MAVLLNPTFTDDDHRYSDDAGNVYPSVTQVIGDYWPIDRRFYHESGTRRGSDVHAITAMMDNSGLAAETAAVGDPVLLPYLRAWETYRTEYVGEIEWIEQSFIVEELGYAGTIDRVVRIGDRVRVIDIKTGAPEKWHELQQGAYALAAVLSGMNVSEIASVHLSQAGKYKVIPHTLDRAMSAWKALMQWSHYRTEMKR